MAGTERDEVASMLSTVDLESALKLHETPIALFGDHSILEGYSSPLQCAKDLISRAFGCSFKMNYALESGTKEGFIPLADATPYGDLLGTKYARAINELQCERQSNSAR